jgi:predicted metal-dependent hydrolase
VALPCLEAPPAGLLKGIEEFNRGAFYECHDTLEALWVAESRSVRQLYQGILQVAVAFYHLRAGRFRPVVTLLTRGSKYLEPFAPTCMGMDVAGVLRGAAGCLDQVQALGAERLHEFDWSLVPEIGMASCRPGEQAELAGGKS